MREKRKRSPMDQMFFLVSMAILLVMTIMVNETQGESQNQNETEDSNSTRMGISVNETGKIQTHDFKTPSAPKIHNPNPNSASSSVHLIYHENYVVDQTLWCLFNGKPKPAITWIKNGHKFLSAKSIGVHTQGNESFEHVKLRLHSTTIQPTDFENGHVNFSCVANNQFGSDHLDFIIMMDGKFEYHSENSESTTTSEKSSTLATESSKATEEIPNISTSSPIKISTSTVSLRENENSHSNSTSASNSDQKGTCTKCIIILIVIVILILSFILIPSFSFLWKKRRAFARARARACAVGGVGALTFQCLIENAKNDSQPMKNGLPRIIIMEPDSVGETS